VDVANALVSNGHAGSITFISRSGKLPKVQGVPARFGERYILYNLARELEGNEKLIGGALDAVISKMKYLILEHDPQAIAHLSGDGEASEVLKEDIRAAESGSIIWQLVIGATAPLLERYWNTFTIEEKQHWLKDFNSTWVTHRHSMPLENGKKILELLESGQLQVVKGSKVLWNESKQRFVLEQEDGNGRSVEGDFLIESLGQEFDTAKINSQLLKTLLSSGLLQSHPVCGIDVDFDTLKTASGIHVIGSLTKGVHFYVTATDRVTAHASRIANSLVKLPPRKPLHIAFFVGSDLFSHLMLSKLVPRLLCLGHLLFIFLPKDSGYAKLKNTNPKPYELEKLQFWERTALQDTIIPLLGTAIQLGAKFLTVQQLASHYGLLFQPIPNINDTSFLQTLKGNHIDIGISLRCYQRFKSPIISYFNSPGRCLLNLHPGKLPEYRGVMTAFRAMSNADLDFGYSLHHIDENFDAGAIIDIKTGTIDYSKAMLEGMNGLYEIGVGMVMDAIERFARGGDLKDGVVEQEVEKARYFTFPTEEEIREGGEKGVEIVGDGALELLVECFGGEDGELKELLREKIGEAWRKWELDMAGNAEV
jgi:hypothetical protein